jgi:hypothetical protein
VKLLLALTILTGLIVTACQGVSAPDQESPLRGTVPATYTSDPVNTPTPTPPGTWETRIYGRVYDKTSESGEPIAGASIRYLVLQSYFQGLQEGRTNETISDEFGEFSLTVLVHDTDSIRIEVEAPGYGLYEERPSGISLAAGKRMDIGLTPIVRATIEAP